MKTPPIGVIASEAKQSKERRGNLALLDCFVASAPRNDAVTRHAGRIELSFGMTRSVHRTGLASALYAG